MSDELTQDTGTAQLNVRVPRELFNRVSSVAAAVGKPLATFVSEILEERTRQHLKDIQRIREREKVPKQWSDIIQK
jgi:predicted DNA-binding protein